jgi:hypothetical protein
MDAMLFKIKLPQGDRGGAAAQGQAVARGTATKEGGHRATDPVAMDLGRSGGTVCPRPMLRPGPGAPARRTRAPATRRENRYPLRKNGRHSFGPPARLASGSTPPGLPAVMVHQLKDMIDACQSIQLT